MTTYEVIVTSSIVYSDTSANKVLGSVYKGTQIQIINISNSWAYFKFNDQDAYIILSDLQQVVTGTVTIKYVDETSLTEISTTEHLKPFSLSRFATLSASTLIISHTSSSQTKSLGVVVLFPIDFTGAL